MRCEDVGRVRYATRMGVTRDGNGATRFGRAQRGAPAGPSRENGGCLGVGEVVRLTRVFASAWAPYIRRAPALRVIDTNTDGARQAVPLRMQ